MRSFPDAPPPGWPAPIVALGNFDGVHLGHQALIAHVRARAVAGRGTAVVLIFDPHPAEILRPGKAAPLLMTRDQRIEAFSRAGVEAVAVVRFTHDLSRWEPEQFVERVLIDWLRVSEVWVGENFLFGRDRTGTFTLLRALGQDRGFRADKIDPVMYKDFVVSSTRIRRLLAEGRVDEAAALLGRPYAVRGLVVHGDARGRELGVPTANVRPENALLPAHGIYATRTEVAGAWFPSATSVGVRPTIGHGLVTVETHLLEGGRDLYGERIQVAFVQRLRDEMKFDSLDALAAQMQRDLADARRVLADRQD
jgi:riboflavin kinase/FMN adenylyltransferase